MRSGRRELNYLLAPEPTGANMFTSGRIAKGFAGALVLLTLIGYVLQLGPGLSVEQPLG
jgi:hypothetical protein